MRQHAVFHSGSGPHADAWRFCSPMRAARQSYGRITDPISVRRPWNAALRSTLLWPLLLRSISIVIPAYNEEKRLPSTLDRIVEYLDQSRFTFAEILVRSE